MNIQPYLYTCLYCKIPIQQYDQLCEKTWCFSQYYYNINLIESDQNDNLVISDQNDDVVISDQNDNLVISDQNDDVVISDQNDDVVISDQNDKYNCVYCGVKINSSTAQYCCKTWCPFEFN